MVPDDPCRRIEVARIEVAGSRSLRPELVILAARRQQRSRMS